MAIGYAIESLSRSSGGVVTVNTVDPHPFKVGDKIRLYNVMGGGTAYPFMAANPYAIGTIFTQSSGISTRFSYSQAGAAVSASMLTTIAVTSGSVYANSTDKVQVVLAEPHNLQPDTRLQLRGVTHPGPGASDLVNSVNGIYTSNAIQIVNSTTLILRVPGRRLTWTPNGVALNWSAATIEYIPIGSTVALDDGINTTLGGIGGIGITTNQARFYRLRSEAQIVKGVLALAGQSKGLDYAFQRLFDVTDSTKITNSQLKLRLTINTDATTLRSALDTVIEEYQGADLKKRRYYINLDGQLVYELLNDTQPATANAPYKIITTGPGTPNTSTGAATVAPYSLTVNWDQDTTKRALFRTTSRLGSPIADLIKSDSPDALGTAYKRLGAPYFDEVVDYPTGQGGALQNRQNAARSFFTERHAPILSGSFTLRGAGTASYNKLGFSSGYAAITVPGSATIAPGAEIPFPARRESGTVTFITAPFTNTFVAGMQVIVTGLNGTGFSGTFAITSAGSGGFSYASAGGDVPGTATGDVSATAYGLFVRTGTAPNQIVTVTMPSPHGIATGATVTVSGLTGTAGTSMNGTAVATVTSNYAFTYSSTGTNGTATGIGTVTAVSLVPRWEPGQWVDVTAAELGLSGMYRVEQVDWMLEPGSFQQVITVTFNRKPSKTLTKLIKEAI